ncbi:MAG: Denitrification system component NirT [Methyloglobulus sp.]|nr:Denitrification system component NirT [Methyloglobulus sp.]
MADIHQFNKRGWCLLWRPSARYSIMFLIGTGFLLGILLWEGFSWGLEKTNTLEFCVSCHEMRDNVYQEYKQSAHYSNLSGVRASCSDCHVPKDFSHKIIRKIQASKEVWGNLTGVIDTKEKFEAKRLEMAKSEWARMKYSDSRECRNCHQYDAMKLNTQDKSARKKHEQAAKPDSGKTCIDCHKGIVHDLPDTVE